MTPAYTPTTTSAANAYAAPVTVLNQLRTGEQSRDLQDSVIVTGLSGAGSVLTLTRTVGGVAKPATIVATPIGATSFEFPRAQYVALDAGAVVMTLRSDNAADTSVGVTVRLWSAIDVNPVVTGIAASDDVKQLVADAQLVQPQGLVATGSLMESVGNVGNVVNDIQQALPSDGAKMAGEGANKKNLDELGSGLTEEQLAKIDRLPESGTVPNTDDLSGIGGGGGSGAYSASTPGPDRTRRAKVYNTSAGTYLDPIRLGAEESCWFGVNFEGTAGGPLARVVSATVLGYAGGDTPPTWTLVENSEDAGTIDVEGARTASVQFTGHASGDKARVRIVAQGVNGKRYEETVTVEVT